jgi:hypothetical protein
VGLELEQATWTGMGTKTATVMDVEVSRDIRDPDAPALQHVQRRSLTVSLSATNSFSLSSRLAWIPFFGRARTPRSVALHWGAVSRSAGRPEVAQDPFIRLLAVTYFGTRKFTYIDLMRTSKPIRVCIGPVMCSYCYYNFF